MLQFVDDAERQLTLQAPLLFIPVTSCILGQDVLWQLLATVGQSELTLKCLETTLVLPLVTIPGTNRVLMLSDQTMQRSYGSNRHGGGRDRGDTASRKENAIDPEEAERQRQTASHQRRLQAMTARAVRT
jgi:hypothetical protein